MTRYLVLDSLRGVCAILVALFHFPTSAYLTSAVHNAYLFVDFFFVLSGFVITHAYGRGLFAPTFLLRRIGRVWPLHVAMLLVLLAFELLRLFLQWRGMQVGPAAFVDEREPVTLATNLLMIHCWGIHSHDTWNGPSWSVSVEMFAYLVFAALAHVPRRWLVAAVVVAVSWVVVGFAPAGIGSTYDFGVFRGLLGFFLGSLVYREPLARGSLAEALCVGLVVATLAIDEVALVAPAVFALTVSVFSAEAGAVSRWLKSPVPVKLGEWSYSIYMVHAPIVLCLLAGGLLLSRFTGIRIVEGSTFQFGSFGDLAAVTYLVIVVAISSVTYRSIEQRCRSWFNARAAEIDRRRKRTA